MRAGFNAAIVFGATSQKIRTTIVRTKVAGEDGTLAAQTLGEDRHERGRREVHERCCRAE